MTQAEAEELARVKTLAQNSPDLLNAVYRDRLTPLGFAAREGYYQVASFLLNNGAAPNPVNPDSQPPLTVAAEKGHLRIVELLLDKGADINARSSSGTALLVACQMGFKSVVELLLARGADVNRDGRFTETALHWSVFKGNAALVELLLQRGAKSDAYFNDTYSQWGLPQDSVGATPLHLAAARGYLTIAEILLKAGASVDAMNKTGHTPLHVAAASRSTNVCALLLDRGANVNAVSAGNMRTPLALAIETRAVDTVTLLLQRGADVNLPSLENPSYRYYPLHRAADSRSAPLLEALLAAKPSLEVADGEGRTSLQRAVVNNYDDMAEILLQAGANPDAEFKDGLRLLHYAASGRTALTAALLKRGANPNVVSRNGETPLSMVLSALGQWRPQNATMANAPQPPGPALAREQMSAYTEIARLLREHGADEFLQRRGFISAVRGPQQRVDIFSKGTNNLNRYTLMEFLAAVYVNRGPDFPFPDFSKITIHRVATRTEMVPSGPNGQFSVNAVAHITTKQPILVDAAKLLANTNDCSGDVPLEWGDYVEIPMVDHPVSAGWYGIGSDCSSLTNCLGRTVRFIAGGTNVAIRLMLELPDPRFAIAEGPRKPLFRLAKTVLHDARFRNLLRSSSDLSRVTVTRTDPLTKGTKKMTFDLNAVALPDMSYSGSPPPIPWAHDLWLRDGDVIEVPDKP